GIFGFEPNLTVYTRAGRVASSDGLVGFALDALREAYFGEEADRLILIDYEALTRQPKETIGEIYKFIGEAPFAHDFHNVEYSANECDIRLGTPNLHTEADVELVRHPPRHAEPAHREAQGGMVRTPLDPAARAVRAAFGPFHLALHGVQVRRAEA